MDFRIPGFWKFDFILLFYKPVKKEGADKLNMSFSLGIYFALFYPPGFVHGSLLVKITRAGLRDFGARVKEVY